MAAGTNIAAALLAAALIVSLGAADAAAATRARARKAAAPQCPAVGTQSVTFARIADGGSFILRRTRIEVKLAGILPLGAGGESQTPADAARARNVLADLLSHGPLAIAPSPGRDRYGRVLAQIFAGGVWVQGALLRQGEARAAPDGASALCAKDLLAAEEQGRQPKAGHWADGRYQIDGTDHAKSLIGTYQIVEGTAQNASLIKGRAYINFGADYRTDFTVTVAPADMKLFRQERVDPRRLAGRHLRVRGWLDFYNGPEIEITTPGAIEMLDERAFGDEVPTKSDRGSSLIRVRRRAPKRPVRGAQAPANERLV